MNEDLIQEQFIRQCSIRALSKMLKMFQPDDFDKAYVQIARIYNKHYGISVKDKDRKEAWNKRHE